MRYDNSQAMKYIQHKNNKTRKKTKKQAKCFLK
jgi:hypothetical protein